MDTVIHIWNKIVQSNTFNFIIMLLFLAWVVKKFDISGTLENFRNSVINSIEKAKEEKNKAKTELRNAEKAVANLEEEVAYRINNAKKHAENVANSIISQTENKLKQIENNVERVVEAEEKTISAKLASKTAKASAELSKNHIISLLKAHPELHQKYIEQSIQELG